jgi:hypothetical protein
MVDTVRTRPPDDTDDEGWLRRLALPEEYLIVHYPMARGSLWRWFQSDNVIDLVRIRYEQAKQHTGK